MALSNSQYDAIMRVYNQRQFQDKREQDKRIAEVYEKVPQVEALSDEIAATMAQAARKILAGDRAAADLLYFFGISDSLYMRVCAEFEIYSVGIVDCFLNKLFSDKLRQIAADLV